MAYVTPEYLDIQDGDFAPVDTWYVGENSVDSGGNYNVFFQKLPTYNVIESLSITETLTAVVFTGQQRVSEGIFIDVLGQNGLTSNTNYANGIGVVFTAPRTTSLGTFRWKGVYAGSNAVSDGIIYVRLYAATYSSGVLGSLIAEKQIPVTTGTSYDNILNDINLFDQGFNVTSGQSYGVTITWSVAQLFGANLSSSYYQGTYPSYYKPASGYSGLPWFLMSFSDEGAVEIPTGVLDAAANQVETGTSNDSLEGVYSNTSYKTESPTSQFANSYLTGDLSPSAGSGSISSSSISGIRFTANQTGNLGRVTVRIENGTNFSSSTPGTISLRNHSTGTTLASIPFLPQQIPVAATNYTFDFSSVPGASLTQGTTYNIVLAGGADWSVSDFIGIRYYSTGAIYDKIVALGYQFFSGNFVTSAVNLKAFLFKVEQAVNYDVVDSTSLLNSSSSETGTVDESSERILNALGFRNEFSNSEPFLDTFYGYSKSSASVNGDTVEGYSQPFVANQTTKLGLVTFNARRFNTAAALPTQPFTIEVWQGVVSSAPQTLLTSTSMSLADISSDFGGAPYSVDFSAANITLTSGQTYAIVFREGSDWNGGTQYLMLSSAARFASVATAWNYQTNFVSPANRLTFGFWGGSDEIISLAIYPSYQAESSVSALDAQVTASETGSSSETTTQSTSISRLTSEPSSGDGAMELLQIVGNGNSGGILSSTRGYGVKFIAPRTGRLGLVRWIQQRSSSSSPAPTTSGKVQLWSLSTTSLTGTITTKLAEFDLTWVNQFIVPGIAGDFSNITGADVVSGNAYALLFYGGSDWGGTNNSMVFSYQIDVPILGESSQQYLGTYYESGVTNNFSSGWIPQVDLDYTTTTTDTFATALSTSADSTETGTVVDSPNSLRLATGYAVESNNTTGSVLNTFEQLPSLASPISTPRGQRFVATNSGHLKSIAVGTQTSGTITDGTFDVQVWQLASNSISALPQTLLGTVTLSHTNINKGIQKISLLDISSANVSITAGTYYAIVLRNPTFSSGSLLWTSYDPYNSGRTYNYLVLSGAATYAVYYNGTSWAQAGAEIFLLNTNLTENTAEVNVGSGLFPVDLSETGTSDDSSTRAIAALRYSPESSAGEKAAAALQLSTNSTSLGGGSYSSASGSGISFIAPRSGRLGDVRIYTSKINNNTGPTSPAYIELWSLTTITSTPIAKLAEVPFYFDNSVSTSQSRRLLGGFSDVAGADVIAGNAYAVVIRVASDWNSGTNNYQFWGVDYSGSNIYYINNLYGLYASAFIHGVGNPSNSFSSTRIAVFDVDYATTNTDTFATALSTSADSTETGSTTESSITLKTANSWNYESSSGDEVFSSFVPSLASVTAYSLYAASTGTGVQAAGSSFIAGSTTAIGKVTFVARKNGVVGNQPGTAELWQLSSNNLTATPSILLASVPFNITLVPTAPGGAGFSVDFTGVSGASVTAGVGYAIVCRAGSDWTNTSAYVTIYGTNSNNAKEYNTFYPSSRVVSVNTSGNWVTPATNVAGNIAVEPANTTIEYATQSSLLFTDLAETGTSTDLVDRALTQRAREDEAPGGLLVAAIPTFNGGSGSTGETYVGVKFIANQSTQLGDIYGGFYRNGAGSPTSTLGALELWQLSSNSITAPVQTKIAEVPFDLRDVSTSSSNNLNYMGSFKSNPSATVVEGNAYAVIFVQGADWSITSSQRLYDKTIIQSDILNTLPYTYILGFSSRDTVLSSTQYGKGWKIQPAFNNAQEQSVNIITTSAASTETGTSTDALSALKLAYAYSQDPNVLVDTYLGEPGATNSNFIDTYSISFTPTTSYKLSTVKIGISKYIISDVFDPFTVDLYQGATLLASKQILHTQLSDSRYSPLIVSFGQDNILLSVGTTYKVQVTANPAWVGILRPIRYYYGSVSQNWSPYRYNYQSLLGVTFSNGTEGSLWTITGEQATDEALGGFDAFASLLETLTLSEENSAILELLGLIDESQTATDSIDNLTSFVGNLTETGTSSDIQSNLIVANAWNAQSVAGDALVNANSGFSPNSITNYSVANTGTGTKFIASKSTNLGMAIFKMSRVNTGFPLPTQPGTVELWQLSSNSLTSIPQTLLASVSFNLGSLPTNSTDVAFDFTDVSGASITAGVGYAIVVRTGSDWSTSTQYFSVSAVTTVAQLNYLSSKYASMTYTSAGVWSNTTSLIRVLDLYPANTTVDVLIGGFDAFASLLETVNSSEENSALLQVLALIDETGTSTDSISVLATFVAELSETADALGFETVQTDFVSAITETGTTTDSLIGNYLTDQFAEETGTASDNQDNIVSFISLITESITSIDSLLAIYSTDQFRTETVTTDDSSFNIANFVSAITETGISDDAPTGNYLTDQFAEETGTASDNQVNIVSFISFATETVTTLSDESVLATFVSDIFETGTVSDEHTNTAILQGLGDEALSALESSNNTTVFVTELTEAILSEETQSNVVSFISSLSETLDPTATELSNVDFVSFADELASANDESFNIASRIADLTEQLFLLETSETQIAFVSAIDELLNGVDTPSAVFTTFSDIVEYIASDDNNQAFADFVSSIIENLENIDSASSVKITASVIEELVESGDLQSGISSRIADLVEALAATDSSTKQAIFRTIIEELGIAEDQLAAWMLVAIDWDTLAYQFANVDFEYDDIYIEGIEVLYGNNMECYAELSYDGIYVDDLEVGYGNLPSVGVADDGSVDFRYVA